MSALVSIKGRGISKAFGDGALRKDVLRGVDIDLKPGQLTLLMGPSGSGKSTLLAAVSGLLQPDAGTVHALGADLWALADAARERFRLEHCGFVFQGFNLFAALTALEQVQMVLEYTGITSSAAKTRAAAALEEVGLADRMHLRPQELSGGEKQRVAVARALAKEPRVVFADEPTAALDKANGEIVIALLRRVAYVHGACVFCVTHDPRLVARGDRILHIDDGCLVGDEQPSEGRQ
jgi:putative ABC transport system ATP-binding protein